MKPLNGKKRKDRIIEIKKICNVPTTRNIQTDIKILRIYLYHILFSDDKIYLRFIFHLLIFYSKNKLKD